MPTEAWRYLSDDGASASFGLAADEYMARRPAGVPTLRLYTYRSHCALVGRFQHVDAEVHRAACAREGVAINRRPTGGGAILMGADQLGLAITIPAERRSGTPGEVRHLFEYYARGVLEGLELLGVHAAFHRKNDLEVNGRKIAGLGFHLTKAGGILFHTSLLVDLDVALMLRVLRTPFEKISDKHIRSVAQRITTVRREGDGSLTVPEVRDAVKRGYQVTLAPELETSAFTAVELEGIRELERTRYCTDDWVMQRTFVPEAFGQSKVKTEGGLVHVHLTLAGTVIRAVYITGDFFADEGAVPAIERGLKRTPASESAVRAALDHLAQHDGRSIPGVSTLALTRAVLAAATAARARDATAVPGACFA